MSGSILGYTLWQSMHAVEIYFATYYVLGQAVTHLSTVKFSLQQNSIERMFVRNQYKEHTIERLTTFVDQCNDIRIGITQFARKFIS